MPVRRLLACAVVAASAVCVAPARAAVEATGLRVVAKRSGWVDVRIPKPFQLGQLTVQELVVKGGYAGFFAVRVGDPTNAAPRTLRTPVDSFGALYLRVGRQIEYTAAASGRWALTANNSDTVVGEYPAGTYRVYAFGDRPFSVRILLPGINTVVMAQPRTPMRATMTTRRVPGGAPGQQSAEVRTPFAVRAAAGVWHGFATEANGTSWALAQCVAPRGGPCATVPDYHFAVSQYDRWAAAWATRPAELAAGSWDVVQRITASATVPMTQFVLAYEAPAPPPV